MPWKPYKTINIFAPGKSPPTHLPLTKQYIHIESKSIKGFILNKPEWNILAKRLTVSATLEWALAYAGAFYLNTNFVCNPIQKYN